MFRYNDKSFASLVTPRSISTAEREKSRSVVKKQRGIYSSVAAHLGELKRFFDDNPLDPSLQCNMDESHYVIDLDDGKTLDFRGSKHVKYMCRFSGKWSIRGRFAGAIFGKADSSLGSHKF